MENIKKLKEELNSRIDTEYEDFINHLKSLDSSTVIDRADVCVLVIDAQEGIIEHDKHIASYAIEAGKGLVLVVNKWDTIENKDQAIKEWKILLENEFQFMTYAKVVFLSALTKKRLHTLMPEILSAYENNHREVKTISLNNAQKYKVNTGGIIYEDTSITYYDAISTAKATWNGNW